MASDDPTRDPVLAAIQRLDDKLTGLRVDLMGRLDRQQEQLAAIHALLEGGK